MGIRKITNDGVLNTPMTLCRVTGRDRKKDEVEVEMQEAGSSLDLRVQQERERESTD